MNDAIIKPFMPEMLYSKLLKSMEQPIDSSTIDPSLTVGVSSIDKEHHVLVQHLDDLLSEPEAYQGTERFSEILNQIGRQIEAHFVNEENLFKSLGLPEAIVDSHRQAHNDILDQYIRLNEGLMQGKVTNRSAVLRMIKGWVIDHHVQHDLKIGEYVQTADGPDA